MRKKILAGNWKMNTLLDSAQKLAEEVTNIVADIEFDSEKFGIIVAPPYTQLYSVSQKLNEKVGLSSQDIAAWDKGAYTGEVSAEMVVSVGAQYAILGHSERRTYFGENSETLLKKVELALLNNLAPIFCIGEVLEEREADQQFEVVKQQMEEVLFELSVEDFKKIIIAYEPVWAIGTGKTASPEQAQEIHAYIRKIIAGNFGEKVAQETTILYGGSCKPSNADGLFSQPDIDGGLIGGASLSAEDFTTLFKQLINS